jgi:CHRD domain
MRRLVLAALLGAIMTALVSGSFAVARDGGSRSGSSRSFQAKMNGWEEVPSQVTTGEGRFRASLTSVGGEPAIRYVLRYEDLEGETTLAAHIHVGSRHENGGVAAFLCGGGDKPACPATEGEVRGVIDAADVVGPVGQGVEEGNIRDLLRAMRAGETYANVHTLRAPDGEIRGQIYPRHRRSHHD